MCLKALELSKKIITGPVATQSKAWVYGRSLAGIAGSNPAGDIDIPLLKVLYVVR